MPRALSRVFEALLTSTALILAPTYSARESLIYVAAVSDTVLTSLCIAGSRMHARKRAHRLKRADVPRCVDETTVPYCANSRTLDLSAAKRFTTSQSHAVEVSMLASHEPHVATQWPKHERRHRSLRVCMMRN